MQQDRVLRAARWLVVAGFLAGDAGAQERLYLAPDDHTDYMWSANEQDYEQYFLNMLDFYLDQADATAAGPAIHQSRFSTDGSLWLWTYEQRRTAGQFQRLIDRIKSGHISSPLTPLALAYGGMPTEAVLRSMYYPGKLQRLYGVSFLIAHAMENATLPYGLGSLWSGSGARYSWQGICKCPSKIIDWANRTHEIYRWVGPDNSSLIMKWFSLVPDPPVGINRTNEFLGGYAEARDPAEVIEYVNTDPAFRSRYPYDIIGVFGQGWDDRQTLNLQIRTQCQENSDDTQQCIVSNEEDFFRDFEARYGASLPRRSVSFGNEWDVYVATLAEVTARVRRAVEQLRAAEALATLVSLEDNSFMVDRTDARDQAYMNMGLYYEHNFAAAGPGVTVEQRIAWQRRLAGQIEAYVGALQRDAAVALGGMIQKAGTSTRFFAFNPLGWTRTDIADFPIAETTPVHVIDLSTGSETPSQIVTLDGQRHLRIQATDVPAVGYKVFEIRSGAGAVFSNPLSASAATGVIENARYQINVAPRGAITGLKDKSRGLQEFAKDIGGYWINDLDLDPLSGTRTVEDAGPVSVTLRADATSPSRRTRVTIFRDSDRIEIHNEITENFSGLQEWRYGFNLTNPDVWHEEVGAVIQARLSTAGGHYAPDNALYRYLTLNHFADVTGTGPTGVTLSNLDASFMRLGQSTYALLDTATPQISTLLGLAGRQIASQGGDTYFLQRYALRTHGAFNARDAMRFALAHQNPLVTGGVTGGSAYAETSYSLLSVSNPDILLWALKPAEEGIADGVIARVWNLSSEPANFNLSLATGISAARRTNHLETGPENAPVVGGALVDSAAGRQVATYRLFPPSSPSSPPPPPPPPLVEITPVGDNPRLRCTRSSCRVLIRCIVIQSPGAPCSNRFYVFVRDNALRWRDDAPAKAPRRRRFATGRADIAAGTTADVKLRLTKRGRQFVRTGKKRRTKGVMEIRNETGTSIVKSTRVTLISSAAKRTRLTESWIRR